MKNLLNNVEATVASETLTANDKVQAVGNELREQYTIYPEEMYDDISLYGNSIWEDELFGDSIDPDDFIHEAEEWSFDIETIEERCDTNIDTLFLEEWIDLDLLYRVREHHKLETVNQEYLDNFDILDDVMSINHTNRNKQKFAVVKVSRDWNWIRKVIRNEEGNFEERINPDDKPDWMIENEERSEAISKANRETHAMKMLWKQIRDDRVKYKKLYDAADKLKNINPTRAAKLKKLWDVQYKDYLKRSKVMDELKIVNDKIAKERLTKEAETILHYYVIFQQCAPAHIIERLTRDDVKGYYKKFWYTATISYLQKCIKKATEMCS